MPKPQIMIVEDESIVALDVQRSLEDQGYEVPAIESSGKEAVARAEQLKPDLIIMDIMLKGKMNGIKAAAEIRSRFSIPVIYLTAYAGKEILEDAKSTNPQGYLVKPFCANNLRSAIEIALHKAETDRSRERYIHKLKDALAGAKILEGTICICSSCKKIRNKEGEWEKLEKYIQDHSNADFTHGICPDCAKLLYPELYEDDD